MPSLVWPFLLCSLLQVSGRLGPYPLELWLCEYCMGLLCSTFGRDTAHLRAVGMIEEYLLNLLVGDKGKFLWSATVCAILWFLWGEQNIGLLEVWRGTLKTFGLSFIITFRFGLCCQKHFVIVLWILLTLAGILFCNATFSGLGYCHSCKFFIISQWKCFY